MGLPLERLLSAGLDELVCTIIAAASQNHGSSETFILLNGVQILVTTWEVLHSFVSNGPWLPDAFEPNEFSELMATHLHIGDWHLNFHTA